MGVKLLEYYDEAKRLGGLKGQLRLAMLTKLSSTKAQNQVDTPELIQKFEVAHRKVPDWSRPK